VEKINIDLEVFILNINTHDSNIYRCISINLHYEMNNIDKSQHLKNELILRNANGEPNF